MKLQLLSCPIDLEQGALEDKKNVVLPLRGQGRSRSTQTKAGEPQGTPVVSEWANSIVNLLCGQDTPLDSSNQHIRFHGKEMLQTVQK